MSINSNEAPFPESLLDIVQRTKYRLGWTFALKYIDRGQGSKGLTLDIVTLGYNSYRIEDGENYRVHHYMPVPPASYDERSWTRWVLDQILLVESHEACEFFQVEGVRPFAPNHGPGRNPYAILEYGRDIDARTSFRGDVKG